MVNVNKLLMSFVLVATFAVKAEEIELSKKNDAEKKEVTHQVTFEDVKEAAFVVDNTCRDFFTEYSRVSELAGILLIGRGLGFYKAAQKIEKYITSDSYGMLAQDVAHTMEKSVNQLRKKAIRSCKAAGKRNIFFGGGLILVNQYYNRDSKDLNSIKNKEKN